MVAWLIFAVFLFVACAVLIVAEVFVPSWGLLSIAAFACVAGGIAIFFHYSPTAGWIGLIVALVMIPSLLVAAYKVLPRTRWGRRLIPIPRRPKPGEAFADRNELLSLVGRKGRVLTPLRPVGTCDFDGQRVECVAESGYVQKDRTVEVIRVDAAQLMVRVIDKT